MRYTLSIYKPYPGSPAGVREHFAEHHSLAEVYRVISKVLPFDFSRPSSLVLHLHSDGTLYGEIDKCKIYVAEAK